MKTVNGKNKLERQINKLKRYLGITVESISSKYLTITDFDRTSTFIWGGDPQLVKNNKLLMIKLERDPKPFFFWPFLTYYESNYLNNGNTFVIFKSGEGNHKKLMDLAKKSSNLYLLDDGLKQTKNFLFIRKK